MPFLDPGLIRLLCETQKGGYDAVTPYSEGGQEPLHALYSTGCRDIFENAIRQGERKILDVLSRMKVRQVSYDELRSAGVKESSFVNVNTPEEYEKIGIVR